MNNLKSTLKVILITLIVSIIGGYSIYEARNIIRGPIIEIVTPSNGSVLENPLVEIKGVANNITSISLNDRQITVNEQGLFNEKLLLSPGYNSIKLSVSDRFGRYKEEILELVLTEHESLVLTPSQELN